MQSCKLEPFIQRTTSNNRNPTKTLTGSQDMQLAAELYTHLRSADCRSLSGAKHRSGHNASCYLRDQRQESLKLRIALSNALGRQLKP